VTTHLQVLGFLRGTENKMPAGFALLLEFEHAVRWTRTRPEDRRPRVGLALAYLGAAEGAHQDQGFALPLAAFPCVLARGGHGNLGVGCSPRVRASDPAVNGRAYPLPYYVAPFPNR
jgi:hypothetical protein